MYNGQTTVITGCRQERTWLHLAIHSYYHMVYLSVSVKLHLTDLYMTRHGFVYNIVAPRCCRQIRACAFHQQITAQHFAHITNDIGLIYHYNIPSNRYGIGYVIDPGISLTLLHKRLQLRY